MTRGRGDCILIRHSSFVIQNFLIVALGALSGCANQQPGLSLAAPDPPDLYQHVLQFDPDGNALDPSTQRQLNTQQTYQRFNGILADMQKFFDGKSHPNVLLYVHGGLDVAVPGAAIKTGKINAA